MKTIAAFLLIVALFACKKDSSVGTDGQKQTAKKLYPVTFKLGQFSTDVKPFGATTAGLKDQIRYLNYGVYDVYGSEDEISEFNHSIKQDADSAQNFGTFKDSLAAGRYYIIFAGGNTSPFVDTRYQEHANYIPGVTQTFPYGDSFGEGFLVTVGDSVISKEVVLKRMVSKFTIKILDALPANAAKLILTIGGLAPGVYPQTQQAWPAVHFGEWDDQFINYPISSADAGKKNYTMTAYTYTGALYFILSCYDTNDQLITKITLPSVPDGFVNVNKQYNFSGKLFENNSSFQVSVDDQWGESEDIPFGYHNNRSIK